MNKFKMRRLKERLETRRQYFWYWVMTRYPRLYRWCENHLPFDTLPF